MACVEGRAAIAVQGLVGAFAPCEEIGGDYDITSSAKRVADTEELAVRAKHLLLHDDAGPLPAGGRVR